MRRPWPTAAWLPLAVAAGCAPPAWPEADRGAGSTPDALGEPRAFPVSATPRTLPATQSPIALERPIKREPAPGTGVGATFTEPLVPRAETRGIVLMYHSIDRRQRPESVWPWDFEAHLRILRESHIEIIRLSQLVDFLYGDIAELPARVAVITIDDGEELFFKYAWPILLRHHVPFALGIITKPTELAAHARALSWDQLVEMKASGLCEIASHGHMHLGSTGLVDADLDFELEHSRALIGEHTGVLPQAFIYPLGAFDERVVSRVRSAQYRAAFTAVGKAVRADTHPFRIPRYGVHNRTAHNAFTRFFEQQANAP